MQRILVVMALCAGVLHAETALVLPFFNHAKSANLDWIGESIAGSMSETLASEGLLVLDRDDRLQAYSRLSIRPGAELTHATVLKIGESLDAGQVIYGSYELLPADPGKEQSKGSLRITARILDLKHTRQGRQFSEVGAMEDLGTLQMHLGWQALAALRPRTAPTERTFMLTRPPVRLDAMESYVRGLLARNAEQRHRYFTQAARLDEHYSQPCFQLGKIYWEKKDYRVAAGWLERVHRSDPHYLEAQYFLGLCKCLLGDFKAAEENLQTVAAAVPLNEVFNNLGAVQTRRGEFTAAAANFRKAVEGDKADPDYHFNLGVALWRAGQNEAAAECFRATLDRQTDYPEAAALLSRALRGEAPRPMDARVEAKTRLKMNYEESAYRQLQAELGLKK